MSYLVMYQLIINTLAYLGLITLLSATWHFQIFKLEANYDNFTTFRILSICCNQPKPAQAILLTHRGRVTPACVSKLGYQATIWTNDLKLEMSVQMSYDQINIFAITRHIGKMPYRYVHSMKWSLLGSMQLTSCLICWQRNATAHENNQQSWWQ